MDETKLIIKLWIASKEHSLTINMSDEELYRKAAKQINDKMNRYRTAYEGKELALTDQNYLEMVALELAFTKLTLEARSDEQPFANKIDKITRKLEDYLGD